MTILLSAPPEIPPLHSPSIAMDKAEYKYIVRTYVIPYYQKKINVTFTEQYESNNQATKLRIDSLNLTLSDILLKTKAT
jgi:hypothetical protein